VKDGRNRLAGEQSPYLRQHADNPVDWYPWGSEALDRARAEDRPILLSIGYSACHWCHVMERESFENDSTAALMNEGFVNIKVDREERPDLDTIYMNAVQMLTGSGGWPLTVFLTPEGEPFFGGTYFPPEDGYGRPGFPRVLAAVARAYREDRGRITQAASSVREGLARLSSYEENADALCRDTVDRGAHRLLASVDPRHGGFGGAPKFPTVAAFSLLLRGHRLSQEPAMLEAFDNTLLAMARGGIHDQLAGGFHRYSVDEKWLVPHFEKMLYDNAQLASLYLDGFVATGNPLYGRVARETLDYIRRDMTPPEGGFFSTRDADTDGEEGKTYLWRVEELRRVLGDERAEVVGRYYGVDEAGNFAEPGQTERESILHVALAIDELADALGRDQGEVERILDESRAILLEVRNARAQPDRDEKILTSWNALAIRAFVRGAAVLGDPTYLECAERAAAFLEDRLRGPDGRLLRTYKDGVARHPAYLDDHAFLAAALVDLFEATGRRAYLERARAFADILVDDFFDDVDGGFFFTSRHHEKLIDRPKIAIDNFLPSGNAVAIETLLRLADFLEEDRLRDIAERTLALFGDLMEEQPLGVAYMLGVLDDHLQASSPARPAVSR
jgi:uncharacterized protein YyaL (SSP411 family)